MAIYLKQPSSVTHNIQDEIKSVQLMSIGKINKATGFSLVELMVALAVGLLILLAVSTVFVQISQGARSSDEGSRALENGNFALRILGEELRLSGFYGLTNSPASMDLARTDMVATGASNNCGDTNWPFPINSNPSIQYVDNANVTTAIPCVPATSLAANSPALVVRHATGRVATAADLASNALFIQSSPKGSIAFMGSDYEALVKNAERGTSVCRYEPGTGTCTDPAPVGEMRCFCPKTGTNANKGSVTIAEGPIHEYVARTYYIRPCSRPAGATCAAGDDGGQPIPTLVRRQLDNTYPAASFVEVPVAEGVERMVVSFRTSTGGAANIDLSDAVTARISLLIRSRKPAGNQVDNGLSYSFEDGTTYTCAGNACNYKRYLLTDTIALRNGVR